MSEQQREDEFCNHVFKVIKGRVTGSSDDVIYDNRPSSVYFVSNLANTKTDLAGSYADIHTKISPNTMGMEALVEKKNIQSMSLNLLRV